MTIPLNPLLTYFKVRYQNFIIGYEELIYKLHNKLRSHKYDREKVIKLFLERLAKRNIKWPPQPIGRPLHILYGSAPVNWDRHNIPQQFSLKGRVTTYFVEDRGFHHGKLSCKQMRRYVGDDILKFISELHKKEPVDIFVSYIPGTRISPVTIENICSMGIPSFSFNLDDRLYFRGKMIDGQWIGPAGFCKAFDMNLTNSPSSLIKYQAEGGLAIFWPEGANPEKYHPLNLPFKYDVSFVGTKSGRRLNLVNYLKGRGVKVECFGFGWEDGPLTEDEMVKVYAQSRINLGFGYVGYSSKQCLKGRDFEVPMSGALYLTSYNKDISRVYKIGEEIITYDNYKDCLMKIKYLLNNPELCEKIRVAAIEACLSKHTWAHRLEELLNLGTGSK